MPVTSVQSAGKRDSESRHLTRKIYWIDKRLEPAEYDRQWIEGIKARCIVDENGCWIWQRQCHPFRNMRPGQRGYPGASYRGKGIRVHRKMLEVKLGRILPPSIYACHTCDQHSCCNPDHVFAGTCSENMLDAVRKGRQDKAARTHCIRNHPLSGDNIVVSRTPNGVRRHCRICDDIYHRSPAYIEWRRAYQRKRRAAKRAARLEQRA